MNVSTLIYMSIAWYHFVISKNYVHSLPIDDDAESELPCANQELKPKIKGAETTYNTVVIGTTIFIFCSFDACGKAKLTWYKGTARLEFDDNNLSTIDPRLKLMKNGSLIVENIQPEDTGVKYVCKVETKYGKDTASAFIDVMSATRVLEDPKDILFEEGGNITFECSVEVDPSLKDAAVVEWYRNNEKISFNDISYYSEYTENPEAYGEPDRMILNTNNSISIQNTKDGDIGSYSCHINTGVGPPLVLEAGTLYKKAAWWWIVIVVLVIIGLLALFMCLVIHYIRNLQKSGKYVVKRKKDSKKKETLTAQIL